MPTIGGPRRTGVPSERSLERVPAGPLMLTSRVRSSILGRPTRPHCRIRHEGERMDEVRFNDMGNEITMIKYAPWASAKHQTRS